MFTLHHANMISAQALASFQVLIHSQHSASNLVSWKYQHHELGTFFLNTVPFIRVGFGTPFLTSCVSAADASSSSPQIPMPAMSCSPAICTCTKKKCIGLGQHVICFSTPRDQRRLGRLHLLLLRLRPLCLLSQLPSHSA